MTGRGAGYCAGFDVPGYMNGNAVTGKRGCRRGAGFGGNGQGRGQHGNRFQFMQTGQTGCQRASSAQSPDIAANASVSREALQSRAQELQAELAHVNTLLKDTSNE